jgi:hypothetical protein
MTQHTLTCDISATHRRTRAFEWLCSDAIERIAVLVRVCVDLDDPEQAVVAAVERRVAELVQVHRHPQAR